MTYLPILASLVLFQAGFAQQVADAFGSDASACAAPTLTDCIALYERLGATDTDNLSYNILHYTFTPISSYANCAISAMWTQDIGEGWLIQTYNSTADILLQMMTYGFLDDVGSGVLARTDFSPSASPAPLYWALTAAYPDSDSWQAGFEACQAAAQDKLLIPPPETDVTQDEIPSDAAVPDSEITAFDEASGIESSPSKRRLSAVQRRQSSPSVTCQEIETIENSRQWRCICNGQVFTIYCDFVAAGAGVWTETDRTNALQALNRNVRQQLSAGTIQPGQLYSSNPLGAFLLTGASGSSGSWHVPSPKQAQCCPFLLERQCGPSRIRNIMAGDFSFALDVQSFVSDYGQCEQSNHAFNFAFSKAAWADWGSTIQHTPL